MAVNRSLGTPEIAAFARWRLVVAFPCTNTALERLMPARDFFSFCTSLKPLELKALGELSYIRHVDQGVVLYSAGQPGDLLYIINRGTVELLDADTVLPKVTSALSRGDFVGDLETLGGTARLNTARAAESLSVRCIHREDFGELLRRVPSLFLFMSENLASRLHRLASAAPTPVAEKETLELGGSLANFDLVTVYQTIVQSAQTGELRIFSENSDLTAAFVFENGQPRSGQFEHLTGEEALLQLFLRDALAGTFEFNSRDTRLSDCVQSAQITRHAGDMLITAIQGRDELHQLKDRFHQAEALLNRRKLNFEWPDNAPAHLRPTAEHIWQIAYSTPTRVASLYNRCAVCELKIYQIVDTLTHSGHLVVTAIKGEIAHEKVA